MKPKRWVLFSVSALLILSALCAGTVYLVDPFEQYRESAILPLYDQESYNILNLDNYFDASHHSGAISDALMQDMAEGQCRVLSVSDMEEGSERIRRAVDEFAKKYGR